MLKEKNMRNILIVLMAITGTLAAQGESFSARSNDTEIISDDADVSNRTERYLGCAVDRQQCGMRAARYGYSGYRAESYYACPNASKFGCWGIGTAADSSATDGVSAEFSTDEYCPRITKQIICVSTSGCSWRNGHCVND